jgi:peptidoglycan/LPS O-acetylase OafA/YrhL
MDRADPASPRCTAAGEFGYRRWLDGLRGVAILLVLICHMNILRGGFLGVDLFFVLSGFLITSLLVHEWERIGSISLTRFYARRALRLLPAFWVLLVICLVASQYLPPTWAALRRKEILVAACYVTNWPLLHHATLSMFGHTWSLSIEEQFYLIWPPLLYGLLRSGLGRRSIIGLVIAGMIATALHRWHLAVGRDLTAFTNFAYMFRLYTGLDTRADALLAGCLVGLLTSWDLVPRSPRWVSAYGTAALVATAFVGYLIATLPDSSQSRLYCGLFSAIEVSLAVILLRLVISPPRQVLAVLESRALVGTGRISYALYLFHLPIILCLASDGGGLSLKGLLVAWLSFAAAICSYFLIEQPFLRLKGRLRRPDRSPDRSVIDTSGFAKSA